MEKPKSIKDPELRAYCAFLEAQIEGGLTQTKKKFYKALQKQLDHLADEMMEMQISMKSRNDAFDNFFDIITKGEAIVKAMANFEAQAIPKDESKKLLSAESAENFMGKHA